MRPSVTFHDDLKTPDLKDGLLPQVVYWKRLELLNGFALTLTQRPGREGRAFASMVKFSDLANAAPVANCKRWWLAYIARSEKALSISKYMKACRVPLLNRKGSSGSQCWP